MPDDRVKNAQAIVDEVARLESLHRRIVEGGQRGGRSTSDAKREAGRRNAELARKSKEMYRKFPILRTKKGE